MASEATLKLLLLGEDRSAGRALRGVSGDADKAGKSFFKMGTLAKTGALAVVAGAGLAVKFGMDAAKAAAEDARQQALLAKQLQNSAGATRGQVKATEEWIAAQGKALGVTDDELRPALGILVRATGDVSKAQERASLAMDVAKGSGKDLTSVATALAKAENGNVGALGRLGIATKDADGKTKSFAEIQKDLTKQFGGAAKTNAETYAGKMDRLKLIMGEAKESIGAKLLPILTDLADWFLKKGLPAIQDFGNWLAENVIPTVKDLAEKYISGLVKGFDNFKSKLGDLQPFLDLVGNILKNVLVPVIGKIYQVLLPAMGFQLGLLVQALGAVGRAGIWLWNNALQPTFKFLAQGIAAFLDGLGKMFNALSKFPGAPKWIKDTAEALDDAADEARRVADNINKIPTKKDVKITVTSVVQKGPGGLPVYNDGRPRAVGGRINTSGVYRTGELGPENVYLPAGSYVQSNLAGSRMGGGSAGEQRVVNITVNGALDPRSVARQIREILTVDANSTGAMVGV